MSEFQEQCALFEWSRNPAVQKKYHGIDLLEASLNGVHLSKAQAGKAWAAGMLRGALDLNLPVARGRYHGLRIEMKFGKNKMTDDQKWYAGRLVDEGWCVVTSWDWQSAQRVIIEYLAQEDMFAGAEDVCRMCGRPYLDHDDTGAPAASTPSWSEEFFQGASP